MTRIHELDTARLRLRQWQQSDRAALARMNQDAEVMRHFPAMLSEPESDALAQRCSDLIEARGWGFWAAQDKATGSFIGFIGLHVPAAALPFSPCVEIGWRLAAAWWGKGLATEGARAALAFAFEELRLPEVVSFTALSNTRSERVMQRLGMRRDEATFLHPALPEGHSLREHCLYRASAWPSHGHAPGSKSSCCSATAVGGCQAHQPQQAQ